MRLSEYCSSADIDRAIAVAVDSFVGSQKVSAKKALARAFAKYTLNAPGKERVRKPTANGRRVVGVGA
jgi:DNA replication licensing factor MCM2